MNLKVRRKTEELRKMVEEDTKHPPRYWVTVLWFLACVALFVWLILGCPGVNL